jgi:hypothetical protein
MKTWQERLGEALEGSRRGKLSEEEREVIRGAVEIFVEEISRRGMNAQIEDRTDRIGLRIGNDGGGDGMEPGLRMEMVIQFEPEATLSVFSEGWSFQILDWREREEFRGRGFCFEVTRCGFWRR